MEILPGIRVITDRIDATTLTVTIIGDAEGMIIDGPVRIVAEPLQVGVVHARCEGLD